jgi:hypothetical protein
LRTTQSTISIWLPPVDDDAIAADPSSIEQQTVEEHCVRRPGIDRDRIAGRGRYAGKAMALDADRLRDRQRAVPGRVEDIDFSPLEATTSCACWNVRQGAANVQALLSDPCAATNTRNGAACAAIGGKLKLATIAIIAAAGICFLIASSPPSNVPRPVVRRALANSLSTSVLSGRRREPD